MELWPLFRGLGFGETEVRVYLSLADSGATTAGLLAKRAGIARTTVYSALESLSGKGLVSLEEREGVSRYLANPPSALLRMVREEREEINRREKDAQELVKQLGPYFRGHSYNIPRLQFFDGQKSVENMLAELTPTWRESIRQSDNTWWGYQDHTFVEQYRPWLDDVWSSMEKSEKICLVSNRSSVEKSLKGKVRGREIRGLTGASEFSSTIWVLGQYIIMISSKEKPHYAFQIKDAVFSANMRSIFKALWQRVPT